MLRSRGLALLCAAWLAGAVRAQEQAAMPEVLRVPADGAQPAVAVDAESVVHLVYFRAGESSQRVPLWKRKGDLWHVTRAAEAKEWSAPVRVNAKDDGCSRIGFPRIALAADGRVHVAWVTMEPRGMWHARSNGDGFEEERNLLAEGTVGIENGPAVTADAAGRVFVVWHQGPFQDEAKREVVIAVSDDGGATFAPPRRISPEDVGVCSCCGLDALADARAGLWVSFRGSVDGVHRDMYLLESRDGGKTFGARVLEPWDQAGCPTSLTGFADTARGAWVTWENGGRVSCADVAGEHAVVRVPASDAGVQKHSCLAVNEKGEMLVAWADVTTKPFRRRLAWQMFDAQGEPGARGGGAELDNASDPAVAARPDGSFVLVY